MQAAALAASERENAEKAAAVERERAVAREATLQVSLEAQANALQAYNGIVKTARERIDSLRAELD